MSFDFYKTKKNVEILSDTCENGFGESKLNIETELKIINEVQQLTKNKFKKNNSMEGYFLFSRNMSRKSQNNGD